MQTPDYTAARLLDDALAGRAVPDLALAAGGSLRMVTDGVFDLLPAQAGASNTDVLLTVGIHGNETAPVEVVMAIIDDLLHGRLTLARRTRVQLGNPDALRSGERYLDYDLNRLFDGRHAAQPDMREAAHARRLEQTATTFFSSSHGARLHLDLHTAIRGSLFEKFAIQPYLHERPTARARLGWLGQAGIEAVLLHSAPAATFSYFTSHRLGVDAYTLELGKARPFGHNDLSRFSGIDRALRALLEGADDGKADFDPALPLFRARYDLVKRSEAFRLNLADSVENFTPLAAGFVIAEDGEERWIAEGGGERILFPNPTVRPGLRAGIVVEPVTLD